MSEKLDIDGVRFKLEADLSKLGDDLKKGEGAAKRGGENLGKIAGKSFSDELGKGASTGTGFIENKLSSFKDQAIGVFKGIGASIVGAFAIDKVIGFFKESMDFADETAKKMGTVSKATKQINGDFENLGKGGALEKIKLAIGSFLNDVVTQLKALAVATAEFFGGRSANRSIELYERQRDSIKDLGAEITKLSNQNKRTAEEELKLINLKEQLSDRAKKLGLDYNQLVASGKSFVQIMQEMQNAAQAEARQDIARNLVPVQERYNRARARLDDLREQRDRFNAMSPDEQESLRSNATTAAVVNSLPARIEQARIDVRREGTLFTQGLGQIQTLRRTPQAQRPQTPAGPSGPPRQEQRFLESYYNFDTIGNNLAQTIRQVKDSGAEQEEKERRIAAAKEYAQMQATEEINALRSVYAEWIEDKFTLEQKNIERGTNAAIRAVNQRYEVERREIEQSFKDKKTRDDELYGLKEQHEEELAKIQAEADRRRRESTLKGFNDTLTAANATAKGLQSIRNGDIAGGIAGATGGLAGFGKGLQGLGVLAPDGQAAKILSSGGLLGSAFGGALALGQTIAGLFGKSDADRAEEARQQAQRDAEAKKILEEQADYQKKQLALAEASAKLPFEELQRKLRLIDITAQGQTLSGGNADAIEKSRLDKRQAAIQGTLSSQAGAISGGLLFSGTGSSPEALIQFLNERGAQALAVQQFVAGFNNLSSDYSGRAVGDAQISNLYGYRGKVPDALIAVLDDYVRKRSQIIPQITEAATGIDPFNAKERVARIQSLSTELSSAFSGSLGGVNTLGSEISADTGIAENLLSTLEQSQSNLQAIKEHTKKTSENTNKLVETPNRNTSIIDISRGQTRSLGQVLNPGITTANLPSGVQAAVLAVDMHKSLQERIASSAEDTVTILRDSRELLAVMAKYLQSGAQNNDQLRVELEDLYRRAFKKAA